MVRSAECYLCDAYIILANLDAILSGGLREVCNLKE